VIQACMVYDTWGTTYSIHPFVHAENEFIRATDLVSLQ
jgi:hypothetical protein